MVCQCAEAQGRGAVGAVGNGQLTGDHALTERCGGQCAVGEGGCALDRCERPVHVVAGEVEFDARGGDTHQCQRDIFQSCRRDGEVAAAVGLAVHHDLQRGQVGKPTVADRDALGDCGVAHIVGDGDGQVVLGGAVGVGESNRERECAVCGGELIARKGFPLANRCAATDDRKPRVGIGDAGNSEGAVLAEEAAVYGGGKEQLGRQGVHREGVGGGEAVAVCRSALKRDGVLPLRERGQRDGDVCGAGKRGAALRAVQVPGAGDGLADLGGDGESVCCVDILFGGVGLSVLVLLCLRAALCRLVGGELYGGRDHLGQSTSLPDLRAIHGGRTQNAAIVGFYPLVGRDADGVGPAAGQAEFLGVSVGVHGGIASAHIDDGAAAGRRVVADLLEVGGGAVGVVDGHQISVGLPCGVSGNIQLVLQVARRAGGKACRAGGVAVRPAYLIITEHHAVDLVRLGVDSTDEVVAGGNVRGNGKRCGLAAEIGIYGANAIAGIGAFRIVAAAQVEADLIQLGKLAAVPSQVKIAAVYRAVDGFDLRYLRNIVEDHIAARGGGHVPQLVVLLCVCGGEGVGGLLGGFVVAQVGVGGAAVGVHKIAFGI